MTVKYKKLAFILFFGIILVCSSSTGWSKKKDVEIELSVGYREDFLQMEY